MKKLILTSALLLLLGVSRANAGGEFFLYNNKGIGPTVSNLESKIPSPVPRHCTVPSELLPSIFPLSSNSFECNNYELVSELGYNCSTNSVNRASAAISSYYEEGIACANRENRSVPIIFRDPLFTHGICELNDLFIGHPPFNNSEWSIQIEPNEYRRRVEETLCACIYQLSKALQFYSSQCGDTQNMIFNGNIQNFNQIQK